MSAQPKEEQQRIESPTQQLQLVELEKLEALVYSRNPDREASDKEKEGAFRELIQALSRVRSGAPFKGHAITDLALSAGATRLAAAMVAMFADPHFGISEDGYERLVLNHSVYECVFRVSGFTVMDFMLGLTSEDPTELNPTQLKYRNSMQIAKMSLFIGLGSVIDIDFDKLLINAGRTTIALWGSMLAHTVVISERANARREALYKLAGGMCKVSPIPPNVLAVMSDAYMYASYRPIDRPHEVKAELAQAFKRELTSQLTSLIPTAQDIAERRRAASPQ